MVVGRYPTAHCAPEYAASRGGGVGGGGAVYAKVYACIIRRKLLAKFFLRFGYFALTHKNFSKNT